MRRTFARDGAGAETGMADRRRRLRRETRSGIVSERRAARPHPASESGEPRGEPRLGGGGDQAVEGIGRLEVNGWMARWINGWRNFDDPQHSTNPISSPLR